MLCFFNCFLSFKAQEQTYTPISCCFCCSCFVITLLLSINCLYSADLGPWRCKKYRCESSPFSSVLKIWKDWNKFTLHTLRRWSALLRWSRAKLESPELENKQCIVSTNCLTWNNIRWISGWYWISLSSWEFWCVTLHVGWLRRETLGPWFKKIIYFFVIWIKKT